MNVTITFKHLEHTPALDERIREKSARFEKFFAGAFDVKWVCWTDEKGLHQAEVHLFGPHLECHAHGHAENLYKTLDIVADKVEKQLAKDKQKRRNRVHNVEATKYRSTG